jgi:hypothetical protein
VEEDVKDQDQQLGPVEWDMKVEWIETDRLVPNMANPNEQDDATFSALVKSIQDDGWANVVTAVEIPQTSEEVMTLAKPRYQIVAGEHRWRAAIALGCRAPVLPLPAAQWEQDRQKWMLVKDNILSGKLNPTKFALLYQEMAERYDAEVLQSLMGFTSQDAFQKLYKDTRDALPPELQKALDASKTEIKTIDDLSTVLNRLFAEYGETLPSNFMVFSWGKRDVFWVRAGKELWTQVNRAKARIERLGLDASQVFEEALETWLAQAAADDEFKATEEGSAPCGRQLAVTEPDLFDALQEAGSQFLVKEAEGE